MVVDLSGLEMRTVLYSNGHSQGAIRVEQVVGLTDVERKDCLPLPPQFQRDERNWFGGMMLYQDQLVLIVNPSWALGELADVVPAPVGQEKQMVAATPCSGRWIMLRAARGQQQAHTTKRSWNVVVFSVGGLKLAARTEDVGSVSPWTESIPVPSQDSLRAGHAETGNRVMPVYDLASRLSCKRAGRPVAVPGGSPRRRADGHLHRCRCAVS